MPFNELQRRDSWPPTILRINDDDTEEISPIDLDPFSYFLTSPDELDDEEDLSAGIESAIKPTQVREVSPSSLQRSPLPFEDDDDEDDELFLALSLSHPGAYSDGRESRASQRPGGLTGLGISLPQQLRSSRGRPTARLAPPSRSGRGRGETRSLSARRPHSWRVPSPDLESIIEEKECEVDGKHDIQPKKKEELSMSAPTPSEIEKAKPQKRVHWAF
jgi:hypothetical protein